jgi:hypothetical protein
MTIVSSSADTGERSLPDGLSVIINNA